LFSSADEELYHLLETSDYTTPKEILTKYFFIYFSLLSFSVETGRRKR